MRLSSSFVFGFMVCAGGAACSSKSTHHGTESTASTSLGGNTGGGTLAGGIGGSAATDGAAGTGATGGMSETSGTQGTGATGGMSETSGTQATSATGGASGQSASMSVGGAGGQDPGTFLDDGSDCSVNSECISGHCVDGVCCDGACTGQCESCAETGSVGQCSTVQSGAPRGSRAVCAGTGQCMGTCDGSSATACGFPDSAVVCTPASCTNGSVTTASVCNGAGACTTAQTASCATGQCVSGTATCYATCNATSCGTDQYCDTVGGDCAPKKNKGASCGNDEECANGLCVDAYCCESACTGQCQSCSASPGDCTSVTTPRTPCGGTGPCAGSCDGNGSSCVFPAEETNCGAASCSANQQKDATSCNGSGMCTPAATTTCPFGCTPGGDTCSTCRQKSSWNLLTNPGFDGSITGWTVRGGPSYEPTTDREDCVDSGSILLDDLAHEVLQCVSATPSTNYSYGFRFLGTGPGDTATALCGIIFYSDEDCTTAAQSPNSSLGYTVSDNASWEPGSGTMVSPPNAASVVVICVGQAGFGYFDQFYLSTGNASF